MVLGSSGTSGTSRRVVRTTASWVDSFGTVAGLAGLTDRSRVWVPGPLSATMNLFAAVHAAFLGAAVVDSPAGATHAQLTASGLARCLDEGVPLATVVVAGDRLSPALHERAVAAGVVVHHYYGAAELSFVAWGGHADALRPFPGVDVEVRDGELWVRSAFLCDGYAGPEGSLRRAGDWATVGDRGRFQDGLLGVAGRPDAATVGGATVVLADVEAVLQGRATGEVCAVALPHAELGSVVAVALTCDRDHGPLLELARRELSGAARPRVWFAVDRLPVTPAGKTDRAALASTVAAGAAGTVRRLV